MHEKMNSSCGTHVMRSSTRLGHSVSQLYSCFRWRGGQNTKHTNYDQKIILSTDSLLSAKIQREIKGCVRRERTERLAVCFANLRIELASPIYWMARK